jgi:CheY-specific phosphatase CheX
MISTNARNGFDHLLVQGLKAAFLVQPEDTCEVSLEPNLQAVKDTKCVVLTVSSYLFRLMVLTYFTPDASTKVHFSRANRIHASEMSDAALVDAVSEFANMCCGALSRDLSRVFPHIGMSTPNIIDKECSLSLDRLNCGHIQHFKLDINKSKHFYVSLCVSDYADLDFVVDTAPADVSSGALELF